MLGLKKIAWELDMGCQDPSKMEANLGFKNRFLGAQVGFHFGGGIGGQEAPKLASILEVSWRPVPRSNAIF